LTGNHLKVDTVTGINSFSIDRNNSLMGTNLLTINQQRISESRKAEYGELPHAGGVKEAPANMTCPWTQAINKTSGIFAS
jgi:hypothetical protein